MVSVLLPVRDGQDTICAALGSLQKQTLSEFEVIVVDDGSTDNTADKVASLARTDGRIRLYRRPALGIAHALNYGLSQAKGAWIARMDADDESLPERFSAQLDWLDAHRDVAVVGCRVESFRDVGELRDGWRSYESWLNARVTSEQILRDVLIESPLAHPSVMMRREALEAVHGYRQFDGPEDYDLWLRLLRAGYALAKVPRVLLRWRDRPERLTRTDPRYRPDAFMALKIEHLCAGPLARGDRPVLVWGAGRYGGRFGRGLIERGIPVEAFVDIDPRRVGRTRHGRPVIGPGELSRFARPLVLSAVGIPSARSIIRRQLSRAGLRELSDYFICA